MKRLKTAEVDEETIKNAIDLLERINNSTDNIKDAYYLLLDNLNAINSSYPNLYKELEQLIKLPNESDIREVVRLKDDMNDAIKYLENVDFLKGIIKNV